jgi:hypothetical protein
LDESVELFRLALARLSRSLNRVPQPLELGLRGFLVKRHDRLCPALSLCTRVPRATRRTSTPGSSGTS